MLPSIPGISDSSYSTPPRLADREPQQLHDEVKLALESALPGIDARVLIHSLDVLLGGRDNYTIVGSASMHLHAIEKPNKTCILPMPNDLDVVVSDVRVQHLSRFTKNELTNLGLRQDEKFAHVMYAARQGQADLKIDIVSDHTQGFRKYSSGGIKICGLRVGCIEDTLEDYQSRISDREFVAQCGGAERAKEKVALLLKYFDNCTKNTQKESSDDADNMQALKRSRYLQTQSTESPATRVVNRRLFFA